MKSYFCRSTATHHMRTLAALNMALEQRKPEDVIHHSDQGSQPAFNWSSQHAMCVRPSMGTVGDAYDNAKAESFFASLECELIDRNSFQSKAEARLALFTYIEGWYNPRRRPQRLGYRSPLNFERAHEPALTTAGACVAIAAPTVDKATTEQPRPA